jgi:hypothetical protein
MSQSFTIKIKDQETSTTINNHQQTLTNKEKQTTPIQYPWTVEAWAEA